MLNDILTPNEDTTMAKAPSLDDLNGKQLLKMIADAQELLHARKQETIQSLRDKIREMIEEEGITFMEIFPQPEVRRGKKASGDGRAPAKEKYKFPDGSTWTGKGRLSNVARQYLANYGIDMDDRDAVRDGLQKYLIA